LSTDKSDYAQLTIFLNERKKEDIINMSIDHVSNIVGKLPPSAYVHRTIWYEGSIARAAAISGYKVRVSFSSKDVTFYKSDLSVKSNVNRLYQKRKSRLDIQRPSGQEVMCYLAKWSALDNYVNQEAALNKLFWEYAPLNNSIEDILLKVVSLNEFYSTQISFENIYLVAKHIFDLNIDKRLANEDESLVNEIANTKARYEYSFATKYCSHHNANAYPIFDSYVDKLLCYLRDIDGFAQFKKVELRRYSVFKSVVLQMREFYSLEDFSLKEIDRYLWLLGKEKFKKKKEL